MIIGHTLIAATAAFVFYDWFKFKKQQEEDKKKPQKSIKLCLTGGPCGGKSQGISCIQATFKQLGAPIFIAPEAATLIGTAGISLNFAALTGQQIQLFQIYLMRLQYNLEKIYEDLAKPMQKLGKCPVILCDRGLLDGKAYAGQENWARMLKIVNITQEQINARYRAVIHMQTAARGATQNYFYVPDQVKITQQQQKEGNVVRKQAPERAIQLDQLIQDCYKNHPARFIIRNYFFVKGFDIKKILLIAQVNQILEYVLKKMNIQAYYSQTQKVIKGTNPQEDKNISPYLIRKRKYKKFINRANSIIQ